ncbi:MAG: alpha/beta fold hydrolase [Janthinobacterium lividum]
MPRGAASFQPFFCILKAPPFSATPVIRLIRTYMAASEQFPMFSAASFFGNATRVAPPLGVVPERLERLRADYIAECQTLLADAAQTTPPQLPDRRFASEAWRSNRGAWFAAATYLLNSRYLAAMAEACAADQKTRDRIQFYVDQWNAATSPSNFLALNPDAQKALLESQGASLRQGIQNLLGDLARGRISQTDESGFVVGENLASTEGAVVFENELVQLIQYRPRAATVHELPLLIVPPCINKFYILDLRVESSLVRHALDSGQQVFMLSWRNPDASLAGKTWDDYVAEGVLQPLEAVLEISGTEQLNVLGFCVGGTLLATALAVLAARGRQPAASLTLLTAMLDFSDTGVLDVFIDEAQIALREQSIGGLGGAGKPPGLMRGHEFATTFSFLRPNDLVWNYVVDNYLKGRTPPPFDLLFWNGDSTNLPGPMAVWYLRHTYLENKLREPGALTVCGESIDLGRIAAPTFVYASRDDHIVPWRTAYASCALVGGPATFVLGASGHIAGVINPPAHNKRSYWTLSARAGGAAVDEATQTETAGAGNRAAGSAVPKADSSGLDADQWLDGAQQHAGSWWPAWTAWLAAHGGRRRTPTAHAGSQRHPPIEAAPGRYVRAPA